MTTATATYFRTQVESATPLQRVVMLYDGALHFLERSASCMRGHDYENATIYNIRAQNIVMELQGSLNMQEGGDLSVRLHALYAYFLKRMISANTSRSPEQLDEVSRSIGEIRESWAALEAGNNTEGK